MVLRVEMRDICTAQADAIVVGFHEDVRPLKGGAGALDWILCGALSRLLIDDRVRGRLGEVALLTTAGKTPAQKIFLVGMGSRREETPKTLRTAARTAAATVAGAGVRSAVIDCTPLGEGRDDEALAQVRAGILEGANGGPIEITLLASDSASLEHMSRIMRI